MEGFGTQTSKQNSMNWNQFLNDNKIKIKNNSDLLDKLNAVNVDELLLIQNVRMYAKETLGMGILDANRFSKGILKLNGNNKSSNIKRRHIMISQKENKALMSLQERMKNVVKLENNIKGSFDGLDASLEIIMEEIEKCFDQLIMQMKRKQESLLKNVDKICNKKYTMIQKQINDAKHKRSYDGPMVLITQPKIKFKDFSENLVDIIDNGFMIDDCDKLRRLILKIKDVKYTKVEIKWELNDTDKKLKAEILKVEVAYAKLPKKYLRKEQKKEKKKKQKKRRRKKYSDSDSSESNNSDSDPDTPSDSNGNDSDSDDDVKNSNNINDIDSDALDWETIKVKGNKKKYKIKDLKAFTAYLIKIKGLNRSGWNDYGDPVFIQTKNGTIS